MGPSSRGFQGPHGCPPLVRWPTESKQGAAGCASCSARLRRTVILAKMFFGDRNAASTGSPAVQPALRRWLSFPALDASHRPRPRPTAFRAGHCGHSAVVGKQADLGRHPTPIGARMDGRMPQPKSSTSMSWVHASTGAMAKTVELMLHPSGTMTRRALFCSANFERSTGVWPTTPRPGPEGHRGSAHHTGLRSCAGEATGSGISTRPRGRGTWEDAGEARAPAARRRRWLGGVCHVVGCKRSCGNRGRPSQGRVSKGPAGDGRQKQHASNRCLCYAGGVLKSSYGQS